MNSTKENYKKITFSKKVTDSYYLQISCYNYQNNKCVTFYQFEQLYTYAKIFEKRSTRLIPTDSKHLQTIIKCLHLLGNLVYILPSVEDIQHVPVNEIDTDEKID